MLCEQCSRLIPLSDKDIERFWLRVDQSGGPDACWPWTGRLSNKGYGDLSFGRGNVRGHRVAFFVAHGRWPQPFACHSCDNRSCCNPAHIFEGTHRDNMIDMHRKGRGRSKLDVHRVKEIRLRYSDGGVTQAELAAEYGVLRAQIGFIARGCAWADV
jgi:hypothetical protein